LALGRKSWPRILLFADFLPSPPHFPDFQDFQEFPANPRADQDVLAASVVPVSRPVRFSALPHAPKSLRFAEIPAPIVTRFRLTPLNMHEKVE
jgi:hypothetical protein